MKTSWWTEVLPDLCEVVVLRVPRMTVCPALGEGQGDWLLPGALSGRAASVKYPWGNKTKRKNCTGTPRHRGFVCLSAVLRFSIASYELD